MRFCSLTSVAPIAALLCGCPAKVATVEVTPKTASIMSETAGEKFSAVAKDADGNTLDKPITWASSDPSIISVQSDGMAKAVGSGKANVTATAEEVSGSAEVTVTIFKSLKLDIPVLVTEVGAAPTTLRAVFLNERAEPIEPGERKITWSTGDSAVATVSADGVVTGLAAGSTTLKAASGDLQIEIPVTVNAAAAPADAPAPGAAPTE